MVGIVIVSHSAELAVQLKALAREMGPAEARIAAAGGVDDAEHPVGTDAMRILAGIQEVYSDEGVLVFMDMGSAVMSAEMALEFLEEEQKKHVFLCDAPLVEGVISATALASAGAGISEIMEDAASALEGKKTQLSGAHRPQDTTAAAHKPSGEEGFTARFVLQNTMGMHARPAAQMVQALTGLAAKVGVRKLGADTGFTSAKSINKLIALGARQGSELELHFSGRDAEQAFEKLKPLFEHHFGESTAPAPQQRRPQTAAQGRAKNGSVTAFEHEQAHTEQEVLAGLPITPGFAAGPAYHHKTSLPENLEKTTERTPEDELEHFEAALKAALQRTQELWKAGIKSIGEQEAAIFDAQSLLLQDPELLENVRGRIRSGEAAAYAWRESLQEVIKLYKQITG
ncbi:MAG: dihydroxyacetone kinase phosphoryl donor subunit DhaM, partial [Cyclonatronaceae bacterium]